MYSKLIVLCALPAAVMGAGKGTNADPCLATCTGSGNSEVCTFTASLSAMGNKVAYYKFAECDDPNTLQPVLGMKQGVK